MRVVLVALALVACGNRERPREEPVAERPAPAAPQPKPACAPPDGRICVGDNVVVCQADGTHGAVVTRCDGGCSAGKCTETCAVRDVELVYVVDNENHLLAFDPRKLPNDPFHLVATLACEARTTPFSMSVDRKGVAWVLYSSGTLYRASIIDGKCLPGRTPTGGTALFGMGFASDGPNATTEKLYVSAFEQPDFGVLDIAQPAPAWQPRGQLPKARNPELSGTGAGRLFGFFPDDGGVVQEIDPATAKLVGKPMPVGTPKGTVGAWAFAHWGGNFYVFVTVNDNSMVFVVDGKTGASKKLLENLPREIVGAGVSTCAPLLEAAP